MGKKSGLNRRDFLKKSAIGTAGLTAGLSLLKPSKALAATWPTGGWPAPPGTMAINPNISNLRVVCMYDPNMITNHTTAGTAGGAQWSVDAYVDSVSKTAIETNMDNMAMWLAQKTTAAAAWAAIFQKPAAKTWAQVKVAIKINTCNKQSEPRVPVIGKICTELNTLGVPGSNIVIYDGACGSNPLNIQNYFSAAGTGTYNGYTKYPGVTSFGNAGLGGSSTAVPVYLSGSPTCPTNLANGTIDILVNIAVNKGHNSPMLNTQKQGNTGGCTLCHKNHFGTFPVSHANGAYSSTAAPVTPADVTTPSNGDYAVFLNMSSAIVGGTPVRQQLCIVDSLWSDNNGNPDAAPSFVPARLVMGTFAGAVDYLTCMKIKNSTASETIGGSVYSCGGPDSNLDLVAGGPAASSSFPATGQVLRFLTLYGYLTTDPNLEWVAITPSSVYTTGVLPEASYGGRQHTLEVRLAGGAAMARFALPQSTAGALEIRMFDIRGRGVRKMSVELQGSHTSVLWDGKNDRGRAVAPGTYVVRVLTEHYMQSGRIIVE